MSPSQVCTIAVLEPPTRNALQVARFCAAAFESLGHAVHSLFYIEDRFANRLPMPGVATAERVWRRRNLLAWLEKVEPDLLFVCKGDHIAPSTIEWIRTRTNVPWSCWFIDDPVSLPISTTFSPSYDYFFTTDPSSAQAHREAGATKAGVLPFAYHPPLHRPVTLTPEERAALRCDIAFVGTINSVNRRDVLEALAHFDLKVWGRTIGKYFNASRTIVSDELPFSSALQSRFVGQGAWGEEIPRIYAAAAIVLNVHHPDHLNQRLFEVPGCGGFLLTDGKDYVGDFFEPDKEVALYDGTEDVADLVAYWLARPEERAAIAEAGFRRAHQDHTYVNRMESLMETCFGPEAARGPSS